MTDNLENKLQKYMPDSVLPIDQYITGNTERDLKLNKFLHTIETIENHLNDNELTFANLYLETLDKNKAYVETFNPSDTSSSNILKQANKLLRKNDIRLYLSVRQSHFEEECSISKHYVVKELVAFIDECSGRREIPTYGAEGLEYKYYYNPEKRLEAITLLAKHLNMIDDNNNPVGTNNNNSINFNLVGIDIEKI